MKQIFLISIVCSLFALQVGCNTLDMAYDQGGAGVGKGIEADSGPVIIAGEGGLAVEGIIKTVAGIEFNDNSKLTSGNIQDGKDGKDGKDGTNGKDGMNGKDGQNGKDGKDGTTRWSKNVKSIYYEEGNVGIGTYNPSERLEVDGNLAVHGEIKVLKSISFKRTVTTGDLTSAGETIIGVVNLVPVTITLSLTDVSVNGRVIIIKNESGKANPITVTTQYDANIDGVKTKIIIGAYSSIRVYSNGSNWFTF